MRQKLRSVAMLCLIGLLLGNQLGCLAVAAGAGVGAGVMYYRGDLKSPMDASVEQVMAASKNAAEEMNFSIISHEASAVDGKMVARTAQDTRITISAESRTENTSELSIRVGTFGDRAMSQRILDKIKEHL